MLSLLTRLSCKVIEMQCVLLKIKLSIYVSNVSNEDYIKRHIQTDTDFTVSGRPGVYRIILLKLLSGVLLSLPLLFPSKACLFIFLY